MGTSSGYFGLAFVCCLLQVLVATQNDHDPMVAFVCNKPAMHRGVNGWISDKDTVACYDNKQDILDYCRKMYPSHNITNVVESSYLETISGWPSLNGPLHDHRVRPFRCIVDSFQSDALLVPQHCKFDHYHNDKVCEGFSHWEVVARDACKHDGMHCESFGMLLNCGLGTFSGVEYVCCPNVVPTRMQPVTTPAPQSMDHGEEGWESQEETSAELDMEHAGSKVNLYELYLKGQPMPASLDNEHQRFEAARQYMHRLQEAKNTQLMKEWTAARDHVAEVRKTDAKTAEKLSEEIAQRFQRLYSAYEEEDIAEKQQIVALHQQRVQADLNQRKRVAMDKYMRALQNGDVEHVDRTLRQYVRVEEKDVLHTVNHYGHVKATNGQEAARIHTHVIQHLQLCQQRMEQALEMLQRYPDIERQVRPGIEDFMKQYDSMAVRIRNVVVPDPVPSNVQSDTDDSHSDSAESSPLQPEKIDDLDDFEDESDDDNNNNNNNNNVEQDSQSNVGGNEVNAIDDHLREDSDEDVRENEHDYEHSKFKPAHQQHSAINVHQNSMQSASTTSAQVGTTLGIAVGSVAIFVVLVVAVVMVRRRAASGAGRVTHGYVEVDPAASPEERHVANMQMNGYENPTYRYFECAASD